MASPTTDDDSFAPEPTPGIARSTVAVVLAAGAVAGALLVWKDIWDNLPSHSLWTIIAVALFLLFCGMIDQYRRLLSSAVANTRKLEEARGRIDGLRDALDKESAEAAERITRLERQLDEASGQATNRETAARSALRSELQKLIVEGDGLAESGKAERSVFRPGPAPFLLSREVDSQIEKWRGRVTEWVAEHLDEGAVEQLNAPAQVMQLGGRSEGEQQLDLLKANLERLRARRDTDTRLRAV